MSSAQKWKLKKTGSLGNENGSQNMTDFLKLTELANKIIETGNMDVYQETYEMINLKVWVPGCGSEVCFLFVIHIFSLYISGNWLS